MSDRKKRVRIVNGEIISVDSEDDSDQPSQTSAHPQYYTSTGASSVSFYANAVVIASMKSTAFSPTFTPRQPSGTISIYAFNSATSAATISVTITSADAPACTTLPFTSAVCNATILTYLTPPITQTAISATEAGVNAVLSTMSGCQSQFVRYGFCANTYPQCNSNNFLLSFCPSWCGTLLGCVVTVPTATGAYQTTNFSTSVQCQQNEQVDGISFGSTSTGTSTCYSYPMTGIITMSSTGSSGSASSASSLIPKGWMMALIALVGLSALALV